MTTIEWVVSADGTMGRSWNPIRGCRRVSPGCEHCYAERFAARMGGPGKAYAGLVMSGRNGPRWTGEVRLDEKAIEEPLRVRKPTTWFVDSMSDLFYEEVPIGWVNAVLHVMLAAERHTFIVLTKRPERIWCDVGGGVGMGGWDPLPNVWWLASIETQEYADKRVPCLLNRRMDAWPVRGLSCEPLLGPIDLRPWLGPEKINWVIAGGESGPGARPCHIGWLRDLRDQCAAAGVPFFFKQWGEWSPTAPRLDNILVHNWGDGFASARVGKKRAGRMLDDEEHNGMPRWKEEQCPR